MDDYSNYLIVILAVPTVSATFYQGDVSEIGKKDKDGNPKHLLSTCVHIFIGGNLNIRILGIVTSQDLIIPTEERVYFQMIAADVKHSFWIPAIGGKLDTNPDNVNKFWLNVDQDKADDAGNIFYGKCAELCGPSHALYGL